MAPVRRARAVSSHQADPERVRVDMVAANKAVSKPDNIVVVSRAVVAKKERKTWKTTRKISAPAEPDSPEVRIVAVRIDR